MGPPAYEARVSHADACPTTISRLKDPQTYKMPGGFDEKHSQTNEMPGLDRLDPQYYTAANNDECILHQLQEILVENLAAGE